jgi:hypothetical protein
MENFDNIPEDSRSEEQYLSDPGPYLARVVSNVDGKYMGALQVELLNDVGRDQAGITGSVIPVRYMSPFYGSTSVRYLQDNEDYDSTQKSYGMWMVPPDVGTLVMVIFVNGNAAKGFWIGCVPDEYMNFMVPGLAATEANNESISDRKVVAEFNKKTNDLSQSDTTLISKPVHPFQKVLEDQGLDKDDIRGITTSSGRRETPSQVFGISTPGPVDRQPGAPTGKLGKFESQIESAFVSRLGGSTFVMDDGDAAFQRKTHAKDGPPEYASVENGESGMPEIPHNELVRIRTRTGHQILLHNSEDLIYIGNARGTAWIELTSNGKIDIWAADSVSIRSESDINLSGKNVNIEADENVNIKSGAEMYIESVGNQTIVADADQFVTVTGNQTITVGADYKLSVGGLREETVKGVYKLKTGGTDITSTKAFNLNVTGGTKLTSSANTEITAANTWVDGGEIHLNSGKATASAPTAPSAVTPVKPATPGADGLVSRKPAVEPWAGHENLHETELKYTTATDTFKKISK